MKNNLSLIEELRLGTATALLAAAGLMGTSAVAAQDQDTEEELEELELEEVVVTGSRIRRVGIDTARPAISVGQDLFEKRAFTNIADALNEVPVFGAAVDPNGAQNAFTVGQNFVNLFDLGTQRTLTLVNGRRFVSSNVPTIFGSAGGLQVDLNAVPVALLKNIEIVPLGGAAVYGSDAVAGVVNVTLRDDYEGFEVSGQYGVTEEGDGETFQLQSVIGTNFADGRGNIVFSAEFNKQNGLLLTERPFFTENNPDITTVGQRDFDGDGMSDDFDGDGDADVAALLFEGGQRVQLLSGGGSVSQSTAFFLPSRGVGALPDGNFYQFQPDGNLASCTPGDTPSGTSAFFAYGGTCGTDFFDEVAQIRSPVERIVISSIGHYDINEYVTFEQEFVFANSRATELVNQGGFQSFPFTGTSGPVTLSVNNPFLTDQARGILTSNGLTEFNLNRFNNDLVGNGEDSTENFTWRYAAGLKGEFEAGGRDFFWDVSAVFGQADVETQDAGIVDGRFINAINAVTLNDDTLAPLATADFDGDGDIDTDDGLLNFINNSGTGVANASLGSIVCQASIDNAAGTLEDFNLPASGSGITDGDLPYVTGCVPLNLFGQGVQSAESLAFINGGPSITSSDVEQRVFTANVGGSIVDLPAGPVGFVAGFETRRERANFTPGLGTSIAFTRSAAFPPTSGQLETTEFYGELSIPLTSPDMEIPGLELLEVEGSIRSVRNEITNPNGESDADTSTAWEINGRWSPVKDVTFRATYAEAIRTPSLVELFTPRTQSFISGQDPCDGRFITSGNFPDVRAANCASLGIPAGFVSNISNATIIAASAGNVNLIPETTQSYSFGVVVEPRWVEGLTLQADYFNIEIPNRIENFDFETLAASCFDSVDFPNVPACGSFERDPASFQVIDVTEQFLNAATSNYEAMQFTATYGFDVAGALANFDGSLAGSDLGSLDIRASLFHRLTDQLELVPGDIDLDIGDFGDPNWEGNFDFTYINGPLQAFWRINYQSAPVFDADGDSFFVDSDTGEVLDGEFGARFVHNASVSYEIMEGTALTLSVNNVFDRQPNQFELAAGLFTIVEQLGRSYALRVRTRF